MIINYLIKFCAFGTLKNDITIIKSGIFSNTSPNGTQTKVKLTFPIDNFDLFTRTKYMPNLSVVNNF